MVMQQAKDHIKQIVENYIRLYPEDYVTVKKGIEMQRQTLIDDEFGVAEGTGSDMRALFEIPVDLSEMFIMGLTEEEMEWFKAGGAERKDGARWFARTFKEFALPQKI